jgi:predicted nucleic acid-binding protein
MGWLIDTCIWVDIERKRLVPSDIERFTGREAVFLCPVTVAELAAGAENTQDPDIRAKRTAALEKLRKKPCLIMDEGTGLTFGSISGYLLREGRAREHRIQDLWIAALAIQHGHKLLTRNGRDFRDIPGLELVEYT